VSRSLRGALAALVTAGVLAGIALGSSLSLPASTGDASGQALLLLDWRVRGEETGECLRPGGPVREDLPAHMQNPDACAGELPPYQLRLWVDDELAVERVFQGGGFRGDRPLTVYESVPVPPGERSLRLVFERVDPDPSALRIEGGTEFRLERGEVLLAVRRQDTGVLEFRRPVR
jgi:hypothetical protein